MRIKPRQHCATVVAEYSPEIGDYIVASVDDALKPVHTVAEK